MATGEAKVTKTNPRTRQAQSEFPESLVSFCRIIRRAVKREDQQGKIDLRIEEGVPK